jgi:hypothetical protein
MFTTRARWQVGAWLARERSSGSLGVALGVVEPDVSSEIENIGLRGNSKESLVNITGLSPSVECVGAGDSGKEGANDKVVALGDEVEEDDSTAAGETTSEGDG